MIRTQSLNKRSKKESQKKVMILERAGQSLDLNLDLEKAQIENL